MDLPGLRGAPIVNVKSKLEELVRRREGGLEQTMGDHAWRAQDGSPSTAAVLMVRAPAILAAVREFRAAIRLRPHRRPLSSDRTDLIPDVLSALNVVLSQHRSGDGCNRPWLLLDLILPPE